MKENTQFALRVDYSNLDTQSSIIEQATVVGGYVTV